jgi:hypothetical protein
VLRIDIEDNDNPEDYEHLVEQRELADPKQFSERRLRRRANKLPRAPKGFSEVGETSEEGEECSLF